MIPTADPLAWAFSTIPWWGWVLGGIAVGATVSFWKSLTDRWLQEESRAAGKTTKTCPECLSEVPVEAARCAYCRHEFHW